ncbi:MAG: hypothetical protein COB88_08540 [Flavobacteriales bacterium]|nr:MAG: hypothetical protein COB88_08540 [Flavobacteriales bacterium]
MAPLKTAYPPEGRGDLVLPGFFLPAGAEGIPLGQAGWFVFSSMEKMNKENPSFQKKVLEKPGHIKQVIIVNLPVTEKLKA